MQMMIRIQILLLFFLLLHSSNLVYSQSLISSGFVEVRDYSFPFQNENPVSLTRAFRESEAYLEKIPGDAKFTIHEKTYAKKDFLKSIRLLRTLSMETSRKKRERKFREAFLLLESTNLKEAGKITGYYEVVIEGKSSKQGEFIFPILKTPSDLSVKGEGEARKVGRILNGIFTPYETRSEITKSSITKDKENVIAYVKLVDLHIAQLEGSAIIKISKLSPFRITYDSDNGHGYRSPSEQLGGVCKSLIPSNLLECIRRYQTFTNSS